MGWSNVASAVLSATTVIIDSDNPEAGIFVYSPNPGQGNLVLSITAQAGTDPYDNAFPEGIYIGNDSDQATLWLTIQDSTASLYFPTPPIESDIKNDSQITGGIETVGGGTLPFLVILSPQVSVRDDFTQISLYGSSTDEGVIAGLTLNYTAVSSSGESNNYVEVNQFGGQLVGMSDAIEPTNTAEPLAFVETTHQATLATDWDQGSPPLSYKMLSPYLVQLSGRIVWTGSGEGPPTSGSLVTTLPEFYIPSFLQVLTVICQTQIAPEVGEIDTSGNLTVYPNSSILNTSSSYKTWSFDGVLFPTGWHVPS